jgi:intracellular sulfur oxidation DsrE/DsrF family protein
MTTKDGGRINRRNAMKITGAALTGVAMAGVALAPASAGQSGPPDPPYHFSAYDAIVSRNGTVRMIFEWPNIANRELWANAVNALNAWQFAYQVPADQIQIVVQAYASSTPATYDDYLWNKYRLSDVLQVHAAPGSPPNVNPFLHSSISADQASLPPSDPSNAYYFDHSIEGLVRRGVLFLACNNSLHGDASAAFQSGRNPDNLTADQIAAEMQAHLIPGAFLVPAGVAELARLQDKGYRLVVDA